MLVPAETLHVVAGDDPAHGVAHHVDPLVPGLGAHLLDERAELLGNRADVTGERAVVEGDDTPEPASSKSAAKQGEDRAVVDHAVHQQDRGACCLDVADDETALRRGQRRDAESPPLGPPLLAHGAERVEGEMSADPGHLQRRTPDPVR
jgi:hypothetical protein